MLSKLLAYLRAGGDANVKTISRKLEIEEGTVIMLLDQLIKMGYLEEIKNSENEEDYCTTTKCSSCSKNTSCSEMITIKYQLTKK